MDHITYVYQLLKTFLSNPNKLLGEADNKYWNTYGSQHGRVAR